MENITNFTRLMDAINLIRENFGESRFTAKQYNAIRKYGSSTIDALHNAGMVKLAEVETFIKEVPAYGYEADWVFSALTDAPLMELHEYKRLTPDVQTLINKAAGGTYVKTKNTKTVKCKRYYYQFDFEGTINYVAVCKRDFEEQAREKLKDIAKKQKEIEKLKKEIAYITTLAVM